MAIDTAEDYKPLPKKTQTPAVTPPKIVQYDAPTSAPATSKIVKFDTIFEKYRGNIPHAFLLVLAETTSNLNPNFSSKGSAGLFGISAAALDAFNKAKGENNGVDALADPILSTRIATWILQKIVTYYAANYPTIMAEDWSNQEYVSLVMHGYNAGYSEPKGLGAAIKKFVNTPNKLTIEAVAQVAKEIGLDPNLYNQAWINYAKKIATAYLHAARLTSSTDPQTVPQEPKRGVGGLAIAALVFIPIAGLVFSKRGR